MSSCHKLLSIVTGQSLKEEMKRDMHVTRVDESDDDLTKMTGAREPGRYHISEEAKKDDQSFLA